MSLFGYVAPETVIEALSVLAEHPSARVLAGGNSMLLPGKRRELSGALLVDLRKIGALSGVERLASGELKIGATTSIASLAEDPILNKDLPELCAVALSVGDAQVRNRATIGGNLAACELGADLPALLVALDARIQMTGPKGPREVSIDEFFAGAANTAPGQNELISAVIVTPPGSGTGVAYEKFKHTATLFALCGVAAAVKLTKTGDFSAVRLAVAGATPRPERLKAVEQALVGKAANEESILAATRSTKSEVSFFTDIFASAEYRGHLSQILAERALGRAVASATV